MTTLVKAHVSDDPVRVGLFGAAAVAELTETTAHGRHQPIRPVRTVAIREMRFGNARQHSCNMPQRGKKKGPLGCRAVLSSSPVRLLLVREQTLNLAHGVVDLDVERLLAQLHARAARIAADTVVLPRRRAG